MKELKEKALVLLREAKDQGVAVVVVLLDTTKPGETVDVGVNVAKPGTIRLLTDAINCVNEGEVK